MRVPKSICALAGCCDGESSRYALAGVMFGRDGKKPFAVASDGRRLVHATWDEELLLEFPDENTERMSQQIVHGKDVKELSALCNGSRGTDKKRFFLDESAPENVSARFAEKDTRRQLLTKPVEGRFPRWQDIINNTTHATQSSIRLSGTLLLSTLKAVVSALECEGTDGVTLEVMAPKDGPADQLRISGSQNGKTLTAVQMGLSTDGN